MQFKDKTFKIFDTKYRIKFVKKIEPREEGEYTFGKSDSVRYIIHVATNDIDGKPLSDDIIITTLIHELIHVILDEGQYRSSSNDEPMVEWIAKCIYSILKQKVL